MNQTLIRIAMAGALSITACATTAPRIYSYRTDGFTEKQDWSWDKESKRRDDLRKIVGIYTGDIRFERKGDICITKGIYSEIDRLYAMIDAQRNADTNRDGVADPEEVEALEARIMQAGCEHTK